MSDQHEDESLRRWAREQAEIERQTDALVLRTMTAMVTAAEDLKSKLRRDTESIIEGYQRTKRGLENEISLSSAERQRFRREIDQERETILSQAQAEAQEIVEAAQREREQLLREVRAMEQRLRTLEAQIRSALGLDADLSASMSPVETVTPSVPPPTSAPATARPPIRTLTSAPPSMSPPAPPPAPVVAATAPPRPASAPPVSAATPAGFDADLAEETASDAEPETTASALPVFVPAPPPAVISASEPVAEPPASAPRPPLPATPAPMHLRPVELVFDGVPGYQQASALERAVNDLLPDEDVDIVEFERGQLILGVQATDLATLARDLVDSSSASLELGDVTDNRATFRCV